MRALIAHRKSRPDNPRSFWFGAGSLPAWQIHGGLIAHWLYRGAHRASPFRPTAAEIAESLRSDRRKMGSIGGWDIVEVGGQQYYESHVTFRIPEPWDLETASFVAIAPPGGTVNIPALSPDTPAVSESVEPWHGQATGSTP